jgi:DNA-binding GntR family transcriptional regulator
MSRAIASIGSPAAKGTTRVTVLVGQDCASDQVVQDELRDEPGSAALMVVRRYFDAADEVCEITVTIHPAERFIFSMELSRSKE